MKRPLSRRQREILHYVVGSVRRFGIVPSVREIGAALGMHSPSTVHHHLLALERKGYLRRGGARMRVLEIADQNLAAGDDVVLVPLVGRVAAGAPVLAEEHVEEMIPIPRWFVGWTEQSFLLTVRGDSMTGAGIVDGDLVVVRCQETASPGDIVVALLGDEATVKRLAVQDGRPCLRAENPAYPPVVGAFEILGKVVGLLRRYPVGAAS